MKILYKNDIILSSNSMLINYLNKISKKSKIADTNSNYVCSNCNRKLIKFPFSDKDSKKLILNLQNVYLNGKVIAMDDLEKKILKNNYNAFIDGNNVIFYIDRKITVNSFVRLKAVFDEISKTHKPLITLHRRHKDYLAKNLQKNDLKIASDILKSLNEHIYYTPYKMNDDWFFIWAGINTKNSLVITNDLLRDHINKISEENIISNTLLRWITDYVVRYDFPNNRNSNIATLTYPDKISFKVQNNDNTWHIPIESKKWICFEI